MRKFIIMAAAATIVAGAAQAQERHNPLLEPYGTPYDIPPYDRITPADYLPALRQGIDEHNAEIRAIAQNPEAPTFDNTILALEYSGRTLDRVAHVFSTFAECNATPEIQEVEAAFVPLYSAHLDEMYMDDALFRRVKDLYDREASLGLSVAQRRSLEEYYRNFTRNGALLDAAGKEELKALNARISELQLKFNKNLLQSTNAFAIWVDNEADLAGLPASVVANAAEKAQADGRSGQWKFTLHAPSRLPVLTYADNRDLRRRMYQGYMGLASQGDLDNRPVIAELLQLRAKKAHMLGYDTFAAYMTEPVMAKTPDAAEALLRQLWEPAVKRVAEEVAEMQALADTEGAGITIEPWDYYYYAEKARRAKYALDEEEISGYFAVDSVRNGIFNMARTLYGITFEEMPDAPKYHPEVKVYDVKDAATGEHLAVFMTDYFPRSTKRQGAWMDAIDNSCVLPDGTVRRPIIYNVGNFAPPTADMPALLSLDDVETMFHEFGHGLHGMLSRAALPSQAGTNVDRDFVELPSQIHEHWKFEPELLKTYARHWATGEVIPDSLIAKLKASATHNQGFMTAELAGAALLDLAYGRLNPAEGETVDVDAFEASVAADLGMPKELTFRYRSPYFKHIFGSNEYASGYYTYLWAAVLDCDGYELFEEKGIFDPATAAAFKANVLEAGGTDDPMTLYVRFRGHAPSPDALLRSRGLWTPTPATGGELKTSKN